MSKDKGTMTREQAAAKYDVGPDQIVYRRDGAVVVDRYPDSEAAPEVIGKWA